MYDNVRNPYNKGLVKEIRIVPDWLLLINRLIRYKTVLCLFVFYLEAKFEELAYDSFLTSENERIGSSKSHWLILEIEALR